MESVIPSLLPKMFAETASQVPPEWLLLSENNFVESILGGWDHINPIDLDVKRMFWVLYPAALVDEEPIKAQSLYRDICSKEYFYSIMRDVKRTAFILNEPATERQKAEHLLFLSWKEMRKILEAPTPINRKTGAPDKGVIDSKMKIFIYLDQRKNGKPTERLDINQNQKILQVNATMEEARELHGHLTPQEVDARLAQLEEKASLPPAQCAPTIIDPISHLEKEVYTTRPSVIAAKKKG